MTLPSGACCFLAAVMVAMTQVVADLHILQWNPHWQCFVWNQHDCRKEAISELTRMLESMDVDFANIIEFDDAHSLPVPSAWKSLQAECGPDRVALLYNQQRWRPSRTDGTLQVGCMDYRDRPFIVQAFEALPPSNGSSAGSRRPRLPRVIVIGAHFPHSDGPGTMLEGSQVEGLRDALASVIAKAGTTKVVLVADTNEHFTTSSLAISQYLAFPAGPVLSTSLEQTCCFDNGFPKRDPFDRIIANFGHSMETDVLIEEPLPLWARQVSPSSSKKAAFHKPIRGTLTWPKPTDGEPTTTAEPPSASGSTSSSPQLTTTVATTYTATVWGVPSTSATWRRTTALRATVPSDTTAPSSSSPSTSVRPSTSSSLTSTRPAVTTVSASPSTRSTGGAHHADIPMTTTTSTTSTVTATFSDHSEAATSAEQKTSSEWRLAWWWLTFGGTATACTVLLVRLSRRCWRRRRKRAKVQLDDRDVEAAGGAREVNSTEVRSADSTNVF